MSMLQRAARVAAWFDGRGYVAPEDVQSVFVETLAHRLVFQPVYELRRAEIVAPLMAGILEQVAAP
jgi:MoxR-like ATPase